MAMPRTLDLGCGRHKLPGALGIDVSKTFTDCDLEMDLDQKRWPLPSGQFDEIHARNVLAYLADARSFFSEVRRIARPHALVELVVPYYKHPAMWGNLYHRRGYSSLIFLSEDLKGRFRIESVRLNLSTTGQRLSWLNRFVNRHKRLYELSPLSTLLPAYDVTIRLRVIK